MASALQPEIWRPNMLGVRELITYSTLDSAAVTIAIDPSCLCIEVGHVSRLSEVASTDHLYAL